MKELEGQRRCINIQESAAKQFEVVWTFVDKSDGDGGAGKNKERTTEAKKDRVKWRRPIRNIGRT